MKHTVPFNLFGKNQELSFDILGIIRLEKSMGKSLQTLLVSGYAGFDFCVTALQICLGQKNPHIYIEAIEKYLSEPEHGIDDIAIPIIQAISISGALGKEQKDAVLKRLYPEIYGSEDEEKSGVEEDEEGNV